MTLLVDPSATLPDNPRQLVPGGPAGPFLGTPFPREAGWCSPGYRGVPLLAWAAGRRDLVLHGPRKGGEMQRQRASAALALHLSVYTVRSHVRNARSKLKSTSVSQAVAVAIMLGLVTPKLPSAAEQALDGTARFSSRAVRPPLADRPGRGRPQIRAAGYLPTGCTPAGSGRLLGYAREI